MKLLCRIIFLFLVIGIGFPVFVLAQTDNSTSRLKEKLKRLEQQPIRQLFLRAEMQLIIFSEPVMN